MKIIKRETQRPSFYSPTYSILDDFFNTQLWDEFPTLTKPTSADMWEEDDKVNIEMALPGIKKEDIKINITGEKVCISGQRSEKEESEKKRTYLYRSMESSFEQTFNLPTKIDPDKSEAEFKDGVIKVVLSKAEDVKPKEITIK